MTCWPPRAGASHPRSRASPTTHPAPRPRQPRTRTERLPILNTFTRATLATATALTLTAVLAPATQATRAAPSTVLDSAVSTENCKEGEGDPGNGCAIVVNGPHRTFYTSSHGIVDTVPHLRRTTTGRGRWLGGITSVNDFGSCSAMLRTWRVKWRTCDNQLADISPGNQHVLGTPAYADGFGPTALDVLSTADGSVEQSFTAARNGSSATYFDEVWEDREHVLVVTYQDGKWAVVRLGIDGSMEYAVAPRAGSMDTWAPFQLQTR